MSQLQLASVRKGPAPQHDVAELEVEPEGKHVGFGSIRPVVRQAVAQGPSASELGFGSHEHAGFGVKTTRTSLVKHAVGHVPSAAMPTVSNSDAQSVMFAAADIVQNKRQKHIADTSERFHAALELLFSAVTGERGKTHLSGADQVAMLEAALVMLEPAIAPFRNNPETAVWLQTELMKPMTARRNDARFESAMDRIDNAISIDGKVVELPGDDKPRAQGSMLRAQIEKLAPQLAMVNEQVIRMNHDAMHHEAEALAKGEGHGQKFTPGALVQLQAALWAVDGFLKLSDKEFQHELNHIHGVCQGVSTYAELVKASTELLAGGIVMSMSYGAAIAAVAGDSATVAMCTGIARSVGLKFASVIAAAEGVHGLFVLLDSHASQQAKLDGAVDVAAGVSWFAGRYAFGAGVGAASSSAILVGYAEMKWMVKMYGDAHLGLTSGWMRLAFDTLQRYGETIAGLADKVEKANALLKREMDPEQAADLTRVRQRLTTDLTESIDYLLDDCGPHSYGAGVARYPGAHRVLAELFAPLKKYRHASPDTVMEGAAEALKKVTWALGHASELAAGEVRRQSIDVIERDIAKKAERSDEE